MILVKGNAVHRFVIDPALSAPDAVAVTDALSGATTSRNELLEGSQLAARILLSRGVVAEQRIFMCCADTSAFLMWFWGAMWIGAVPVPVSTMLTEKDYNFLLEDSRAVGAVFSPDFQKVVTSAAKEQPFLRWSQMDNDFEISGEGIETPGPFLALHLGYYRFSEGSDASTCRSRFLY